MSVHIGSILQFIMILMSVHIGSILQFIMILDNENCD